MACHRVKFHSSPSLQAAFLQRLPPPMSLPPDAFLDSRRTNWFREIYDYLIWSKFLILLTPLISCCIIGCGNRALEGEEGAGRRRGAVLRFRTEIYFHARDKRSETCDLETTQTQCLPPAQNPFYHAHISVSLSLTPEAELLFVDD